MKKAQFIIAAPSSNTGKTTLTLGLLRAFQKRSLSIQPFKCGPDYIDPKFHQVACQKTGINLDLYMMSESDIIDTYQQYSGRADVSCIEGVMGLFDGARKAKGSTAELAELLNLPIIFVVNAKATAYSIAPLLYGFKHFNPSLKIAGVIFNRVNTASHYSFLKEACLDIGLPSLGYLPSLENCEIPSRHLGLSIENIQAYDASINQFAEALEKTVDVDQLLDTCLVETVSTKKLLSSEKNNSSFKIAIAKDEGFNFCYEQSISILKRKGALTYFSPIHDKELPAADFVYFPGGYPEYYLEQLTANTSMLESIHKYALNDGLIWAECGGMMYLGKAIVDKEGKAHKMVGIFDFITSMETMKLKLGYRTIHLDGFDLKGHEFHYSTIQNQEKTPTIGRMSTARGKAIDTAVYQFKNVLASYTHLYFGTDKLLQQLLSLLTKSN